MNTNRTECNCMEDRNLVGGGDRPQARELTDAELDAVQGGATGRRVEMPILFTIPVGVASTITS